MAFSLPWWPTLYRATSSSSARYFGFDSAYCQLSICAVREEQLARGRLEQQDQAGVVHLPVEGPHDLESLLRPGVLQPPVGGRTGIELPVLVGIARALAADRLGLPERGRAQHVRPDAREDGAQPGRAAVPGVILPGRHRREVAHRGCVRQVVLADEAQLRGHRLREVPGPQVQQLDRPTGDLLHVPPRPGARLQRAARAQLRAQRVGIETPCALLGDVACDRRKAAGGGVLRQTRGAEVDQDMAIAAGVLEAQQEAVAEPDLAGEDRPCNGGPPGRHRISSAAGSRPAGARRGT